MGKNIYIKLLITILLWMSHGLTMPLWSQITYRGEVHAGNKAWEKGDYASAQEHFSQAMKKNKSRHEGRYNLAGALYKQKRYREAYDHYRSLISSSEDEDYLSNLWYNMGNAAFQRYLTEETEDQNLKSTMLQESIEAYRQALRLNGDHEDARYNLSKALRIRSNPQEQPPSAPQPDEKHEQDKQKQEMPLPENKPREDRTEVTDPPPVTGDALTREDAERMLNAIKEKEMNTAAQISERERKRSESGRLKNW